MIKKLLRFNWILFFSMLALIAIGTSAIWSAGNAREAIFHGMWKAHLGTALFSLVIYFVIAFTDYHNIVRWISPILYALSLLMLVVVLFAGSTIYGGRRWLWFFQPSEIAKLCTILFLSLILSWRDEVASEKPQIDGREIIDGENDEEETSGKRSGTFKIFCAASLVAAIPAFLILIEPDLGTTLALVPAVIAMIIAANIWRKGLFAILTIFAIAASFLFGAVYEAEKPGQSAEKREAILKYVPLKNHQVKRIKTFLFPEADQMGDGYTSKQSLIAISSGEMHGRGLGKAETNRMKFLPSSVSMNDFIFCVWAEETGYMGSLLLLALFAILCSSGAYVAWRAQDTCGRILALGATTLIFAHAYINIAMCVGLVPITGLPLPFISSGRTFLLTAIIALALVQSISIHKEIEE